MKKIIFIILISIFAYSFCGPKEVVCPEGQKLVIDKDGKAECKQQEVQQDKSTKKVEKKNKVK